MPPWSTCLIIPHLLWVCLLLAWSPPEKIPVRAFLMKVSKLTISCSRPITAPTGSQPHPLHPLSYGRFQPWERVRETLTTGIVHIIVGGGGCYICTLPLCVCAPVRVCVHVCACVCGVHLCVCMWVRVCMYICVCVHVWNLVGYRIVGNFHFSVYQNKNVTHETYVNFVAYVAFCWYLTLAFKNC